MIAGPAPCQPGSRLESLWLLLLLVLDLASTPAHLVLFLLSRRRIRRRFRETLQKAAR